MILHRGTRLAAVVLFACSFLLAACVPFLTQDQRQAVNSAYMREEIPLVELRTRLKPDDVVQVVTRKGKEKLLRVYAVKEQSFFGVASDQQKYEVPYGALRSIAIRQPKTGAEVAGSWLLLILSTPVHGAGYIAP